MLFASLTPAGVASAAPYRTRLHQFRGQTAEMRGRTQPGQHSTRCTSTPSATESCGATEPLTQHVARHVAFLPPYAPGVSRPLRSASRSQQPAAQRATPSQHYLLGGARQRRRPRHLTTPPRAQWHRPRLQPHRPRRGGATAVRRRNRATQVPRARHARRRTVLALRRDQLDLGVDLRRDRSRRAAVLSRPARGLWAREHRHVNVVMVFNTGC